MKRLRFLWTYASPWKAQIVFSLFALAFVSFTSLLYPWLVKLLVDRFAGGEAYSGDITPLAGGLILLLVVSAVFGYHQQTVMNTLGIRLRNDVRRRFFDATLGRPLDFFRTTQVGDLSAISAEEIAKLQPVFSQLLAPAFQNSLFIAGSLVLMLRLNWQATLFVIAVMVIPLPFVRAASMRIPRLTAETQRRHGKAHALLEESFVAIREIKGFLREKLEGNRYRDALENAMGPETEAVSVRTKIGQIIYLLLSLVLLTVFLAGGNSTLFPGWTLGGLVAFYFYAYMMTMSVIAVERLYLTYQSVAGALDRIMLFMEAAPAPDAPLITPPDPGRIELRNVTFGYDPAHPVLRNVSLSAEPGSWVLFTGPSGSGKSTVMNLMMGFYEAQNGEILIHGLAITGNTVRSVRSHIGFVGQDPMLVYGTLRDNIAFAGENMEQSAIDDALATACLSDVVASLPQGIDTIVGERGYTLSGGQKARVAIARAIARDPSILILDEANAMLEPGLERQVWQNLLEKRRGKTTIILTHHDENIPPVDRHWHVAGGTVSEIHPPPLSVSTRRS